MASAPRKVLEPGARVDHFRVVRLLAEGGFGEVYLARDVKLGRRVALKVIHPRHVGSGEAVERFLFEVRATARFNHPNIVTVYAVGEHDGMPYVALEYLEGQTLRQRTKERRLTTREVLRVGAVIARALEEAHESSILHRDLKPENVLIPRDGRIRVLDFGLAKKIGPAARDGDDGEAKAHHSQPIRVDRSLGAVGAIAETLATPSQRAGDGVDATTPTVVDGVRAQPTAPGKAAARRRAQQREAVRDDDGILSLPPAPRLSRGAATADNALPAAAAHFGAPEPAQVSAVTDASDAADDVNAADDVHAADVDEASSGATDEPHNTVEHFTLASFSSVDDDMVRGTPPYMAPEQWRGEKLQSSTDIWALGVMLFELLSGKLPYALRGAAGAELPVLVCSDDPTPRLPVDANVSAELADLIARCMDKQAAQRPRAGDLAEALEAMLAGGVELAEEQGPFRGLLTFGERHAGLYFGREPEVAAFIERLRDEPTIAVVGPSGAGKSSFVQAGVVPRLREQGRWLVLTLRPGSAPFEALSSRLRQGERSRSVQASFGGGSADRRPASSAEDNARGGPAGSADAASSEHASQLVSGLAQDDQELARELYETPERLPLLLQRLAEATSTRVLLVVDQLEELVALTPDAETRQRFMRALASAADDVEEPVRLVFTLRDDFLGKLAEGNAARTVLSSIVVLRSPDAASLETIVTRPLSVFSYRYDDEALPREMVEEVAGSAACLPLLSFTARALWERRDRQSRQLRRADYEAIGGVAGALASHADSVLAGMAPAELELARQLLLRMVSAEGTRKSASRDALLEGLDPDEAQRVLARLTSSRLLSVRKLDSGGAAHYELAHESLIASWRRLRHWLDESADERTFLAEIEQAATLWQKRGERPEEVWRDEALDDAIKTFDRLQDATPAIVRRFVEAAIKERQTQRLLDDRRRKRRRRSIALLVGSLAIVSVAVAAAWIVSLSRKEARARDMLARALAEAGNGARLSGDESAARAMARAALEIQDSGRARIVWWRASTKYLLWSHDIGITLHSVGVDSAGRLAVATDRRGGAHLIDLHNRAVRRVSVPGNATAVAVSSDGAHAAIATYERPKQGTGRGGSRRRLRHSDVHIIALASGRLLRTFRVDGQVERLVMVGKGRLCAVSSRAFRCYDDKGAAVFKREPANVIAVRAIADRIRLVLQRRATAPGPRMSFFLEAHDAAVEQAIWRYRSKRWGFPCALSRDGVLTAVGNTQRVVRLIGTDGRRDRLRVRTIPKSLGFDEKAERLAVGDAGGTIHIYDTKHQRLLRKLVGHAEWVVATRFASGGNLLVSADRGGRIALWDTRDRTPQVSTGHTKTITAIAASPDGKLVASGAADRTLRLWDGSNGMEVQRVESRGATPTALAFSPQGDQLAEGRSDGSVRLRHAASAHQIVYLGGGHARAVYVLIYSNDGKTLVSGSRDGYVALWRARRPGALERIKTLRVPFGVTSLDIAADDKRLLIAGGTRNVGHGGVAWIYDLRDGKWLERIKSSTGINAARFSEDGELVIMDNLGLVARYGLDGKRKRGLASMPAIATPAGSDSIARGGNLFVRSALGGYGRNSAIVLSDVKRRVRRPLRGHRFKLSLVSFSRDGSIVATGGLDNTVRVWHTATGRSPWQVLLLSKKRRTLYAMRRRASVIDGLSQPLAKDKRWIARLSSHGFLAAENEERACLLTRGRWLELWDTRADRRLGRVRLPAGRTGSTYVVHRAGKKNVHHVLNRLPYHRVLVRGADRCAALSRSMMLYWKLGEPKARALGPTHDGGPLGQLRLWRRVKDRVFIHDVSGNVVRTIETRSAVSSMHDEGKSLLAVMSRTRAPATQWLTRIAADGSIKRLLTFRAELPTTRITPLRGLAPSVPAMVAIGTAGGDVLLLDLSRGRVVARYHLHGAIVGLWQHERLLIAVSELGAQRAIDMAPLMQSHCALLREVWRSSKRVWIGTRSLVRGPPFGHRCAETAAP